LDFVVKDTDIGYWTEISIVIIEEPVIWGQVSWKILSMS